MPNTKNFITGIGRRKSAVAQIRIESGNGQLTINNVLSNIPLSLSRLLESVDRLNKINISVVIRGGGMSSQVQAICLGVARALVSLNPDLKSSLRKSGYLTVDARVKERKKPGLKRARRAPQWAKR